MNEAAPVLNTMIEDYLANGGSEEEHKMLLSAWLRLGAEYLARAAGRNETRAQLEGLSRIIRDAQPAGPWKP